MRTIYSSIKNIGLHLCSSITLLTCCIVFFLFSLVTPTSGQQGLKAEYFDGQNFERLVATRVDSKIDMSWNEHPPHQGMNPHVCSIRWTGKIKAPKSGWYHFSARVDDGIRVWVGDQLIIDDWNLNDVGIFEGDAELKEGELYDFKVEYFNALHEAEITLLWEIPVKKHWFKKLFYDEKKVISSEFFFQPENQQVAHVSPEITKKASPVAKKDSKQAPKKSIQKKQEVVTESPPPAPPVEEITAEVIKKYTPKNIHFDRAKHHILPECFQELDELASFLNRNDHLKLSIEGHTDDVGNAEKNLELSKRRAYAIARYLVKKGINGKRIKAEGFGGNRPLVPSREGVYHPQNRRVEFIITGETTSELALSNEKE